MCQQVPAKPARWRIFFVADLYISVVVYDPDSCYNHFNAKLCP